MEKEQTEAVSEEPKNQQTQQEGTSLEKATVEQLKVAAFDCDQQMKGLQKRYQVIIQELQNRANTQAGA